MPPNIFIHANNVRQGGGRTLLIALLQSISVKYNFSVTLDARINMPIDLSAASCIKWIGRSVLQRLNSELWLSRNVKKNDVLLCFGNLPPLFHSRGRVVVFVQNRYLVEQLSLRGHSVWSRIRIYIERWWLIHCAGNVDLFVVQTPTMKSLLRSRIKHEKCVVDLPFVDMNKGYARNSSTRTLSLSKYDFIYVASGEPHKNHRNLIDAWCLLAKAGVFPSLCLTVDEVAFPEICRWMKYKKAEFGLKVENLGSIPHAQIQLLYGNAQALIFTSAFESLGLPLIEARQAGLSVLAPELDYVRDVLDPDQVFDPSSPISISRAVKRFLCLKEPALRLLDAEDFIVQILNGIE
jgi:glycosyltransferase involved in cell wall biosynthesis